MAGIPAKQEKRQLLKKLVRITEFTELLLALALYLALAPSEFEQEQDKEQEQTGGIGNRLRDLPGLIEKLRKKDKNHERTD